MKTKTKSLGILTALMVPVLLGSLAQSPDVKAKDTALGGVSGPTANKLDIINELKQSGSFHKTLEGLTNAYGLDNELKGKGPYTFFACDDKGWAKMPEEDVTSLFANNKKLKEVLTYHVVKGQKLTCADLDAMKDIQPMQGGLIKVSHKDNKNGKDEMYLDKVKVKKTDILCSNGIIHIIDGPIMPPLKQ